MYLQKDSGTQAWHQNGIKKTQELRPGTKTGIKILSKNCGKVVCGEEKGRGE